MGRVTTAQFLVAGAATNGLVARRNTEPEEPDFEADDGEITATLTTTP